MVKSYLSILSLACVVFSAGCTVAVPEVSSLGFVQFMSSKSPSPFDQDNDNDFISFSGQCVSLVNRFQFRLDTLPWRDISPTSPTPGSGETVPVPDNYDVDCSNGNFDFYLYMSQIEGYTADHTGNSNYDPSRVEVQGLDINGNVVPGTLIYQRPLATGFRLEPSNFSNSAAWWMNVLETNQLIRFRVVLIDASGNQTRRFSAQSDLDVTLSTSLVSGSSATTGEVYAYSGSSCLAGPQSTFTFSAGGGSEYLELCFNPVAVSPGATIRVTVSAPGFANQDKQFTILNLYQAYNSLIAGNGYQQRLPRTLIRGASYKFKSDLNSLNSSVDNFVSTFNGSFSVNSGSSLVNFARASRRFNCGSIGIQSSQLQCSNSQLIKTMPFFMSLNSNYPSSSVNLTLSSTAVEPCPGCIMQVSGSPVSIEGYQINNLMFNVASGSINYSRPFFEFYRRQSPGSCHEINIGLANSDGNTIPANPTSANPMPVLNISTPSAGVGFYQNSDCSALALRGPNGSVKKIIPTSNGQYFIIGQFTSYNGNSRSGIALINEDGSLDTDYNPVTLPGIIHDLLPIENNRALVAGSFTGGIRLLDETGQIDSNFTYSVNNEVYALDKQTIDANTENIFIGGGFTEVIAPASLVRNKLIKLERSVNPTTGDETFTITPEILSISGTFINALLFHNNFLYIAGNFTNPTNRIARLSSTTLTIDSSWLGVGLGANGLIRTLAVDSPGSQIFIGGDFSVVNGNSRLNFASISISTGALLNFTVNPFFDGSIYNIEIRNNEIYIAGQFSSANGSFSHNQIAKFNFVPLSTLMNLDTTWVPVVIGSTLINGLHATSSGLMIAGDFTSLNSETLPNLGKVNFTNSNDNTNFNRDEQSSISISFNKFDLIKTLYMMDSSPDSNDIPITIFDGSNSFNFNVNTTDN